MTCLFGLIWEQVCSTYLSHEVQFKHDSSYYYWIIVYLLSLKICNLVKYMSFLCNVAYWNSLWNKGTIKEKIFKSIQDGWNQILKIIVTLNEIIVVLNQMHVMDLTSNSYYLVI